MERVERLPLPPASSPRSHVRALYRVEFSEAGQRPRGEVLVRGTGLGYFGRHALAVSEALAASCRSVYGFEDGLLYRPGYRSIAGDHVRVRGQPMHGLRGACRGRRRVRRRAAPALAVPDDLSERLLGEWPAWEVASTALSRVFGRGWIAARIPLVDPIVRRLLGSRTRPSSTRTWPLNRWFLEPDGALPFVKVGFDEGIFRGDVELACYDPVFDLASLTANVDVSTGAGERREHRALLRDRYERATGEQIDEERWLLYQLVRLWDEQRGADTTEQGGRGRFDRAARASPPAVLRGHLLRRRRPPTSGELCAIDVDGVLETSALGFPA